MVQINTQRGKRLKFGVSVAGAQARDLKGALRMKVGEIEYGFPTVLENGSLVVNIPPLDTVIENLTEGQRFEAKLEVIAQDTYLVPWSDTIKIEKPVQVEAQITEEEDLKEKIQIALSAKLTEEKDGETIKKIKEVQKPKIIKKKSNSKLAKMMRT